MERSSNNSAIGKYNDDGQMDRYRGASWAGFAGDDDQNSAKIQSQKKHLEKLDKKFDVILDDIKQMKERPEAFKQHTLPLARIKKIMKSDEDVKMISAEAPILFAKACELFIMDLTYRAWFHTNLSKRKTLQKCDLNACISNYQMFDFLIDIIPRDEYSKNLFKKEYVHQGALSVQQDVAQEYNPNKFPFNLTSRVPNNEFSLMRNPMSAQSNFQLHQNLDTPNFMSTIQPRIEDDEDINQDPSSQNNFV